MYYLAPSQRIWGLTLQSSRDILAHMTDFIRALESDAQDFSGKWHRLQKLIEAWEANILADPLKYCREAWDDALQRRIKLEKAKDAYLRATLAPIVWQSTPTAPQYEPSDIMQVRAEEYHALVAFYKEMSKDDPTH